MSQIAAEIVDSLALAQCPRCDYELRGLAGEGVCPECGRPYDQKSIYLCGWSANASGWQRVWPLALLPLLLMMGIGITVVFLLTLIVGNMFQYRFTRPTARIRLNDAGCAEFRAPSTSPIRVDVAIVAATIIASVWMLGFAAYRPGPVGWAVFALLAVLIGFDALYGTIKTKRLRTQYLAGGAHFDERESTAVTIPWSKASEVRLRRMKRANQYQLQITSTPREFRLTETYVDARVNCTPEQADAIKSRFRGWPSASDTSVLVSS